MAEINEFKCPACGGSLVFDADSQKMKCEYCDTVVDMETIEEMDKEIGNSMRDEMEWTDREDSGWNDEEEKELRVYQCKSCGGELMTDANTAATSCPFCGNQIVLTERVAGEFKPDYVVPFQLDKRAAVEAYHDHIRGKIMLPKQFRDENHIDEIKGVYVPYWLFDADVDATYRYHATNVRRWTSGNYSYTETSHYNLLREGSIHGFKNVPVDGSSRMPDELMESIEPFDVSKAVDFQTAYLAGYFADKYDVLPDKAYERANERIEQSADEAFRKTAGHYATITPNGRSLKITQGTYKYVYYPVWMLSSTYEGRNYIFAMNAQNGKFVGDLPVDNKLVWTWFLGMTGVFTILILLIMIFCIL